MAKAPADCTSMAEIRLEIDRIDQALMELFHERWTFIHRAAEIKTGTTMKADIPSRVDEVRANARARAASMGMDPAFYDALWAQLIRHSINYEKNILGEQDAD
ncbi:chorismate mutase family protein [Pararhizobium sp.]|uniref:chorismate mutase family protein n=1 Tax=Pararhizobium sp. TaxID=1977563 RepID=UPI0027289788|nr:chorismate mutase family protein [Pararhizobium sp.]MDO9416277.1 chorismate mutase family protein [Pararhizobium sp.]